MDAWVFQYSVIHNDLEIIMFKTAQSCTKEARKQASPGFAHHSATLQRRVKRRAGPLRLLLGITVLYLGGVVLNPGGESARSQELPVDHAISATQGETPQRSSQRLEHPLNTSTGATAELTGDESQIGADDLLDITVFEAPEMNRSLRVSANGDISLQLLGTVRAAGLTPGQLELVLQEQLRRTYMKDPHVGVFVRELQSHAISVVGAVKMPGVFQIRGSKTVLELLSMAQGLADDAGDTVVIMRGTKPVRMEAPGPAKNEPAAISMKSGESGKSDLASMPAQTGKGEIVEINLKRLLESDDPALNIAVHPGDIVKVPRAGIVYVVGGVMKPGGFVLKTNENISVLQALALAEGLTRTSAKSQARIIRTDQETNKRSEIPLNLGKILASKAPDPVLQTKDIVYVPDSVAKSAFYRGAQAAVSTATGVAIYRW